MSKPKDTAFNIGDVVVPYTKEYMERDKLSFEGYTYVYSKTGTIISSETLVSGVTIYDILINDSDEEYTEVHDHLKHLATRSKMPRSPLPPGPNSQTSIRFQLTQTEKRDLDELAKGLSASSQTKIDVAKLLRALCDVALGCSEELMKNLKEGVLPCRPSNDNRKEIKYFDRALAVLIKRSIIEGGY